MAFSSLEPVQFCEQKRLESLAGMIGRTPLLAVHLRWKGERRVIHAKAEHYNLTGSIKDRMALNILRCGYATGALKPGDMIVVTRKGQVIEEGAGGLFLKPETLEAARALVPGADVYALEAEWRSFAARTPPRAPDAAFLGWVRKRVAGA